MVAPINANGVASRSRRVGRGTRTTLGRHPTLHPTTTWLWPDCSDGSSIAKSSPSPFRDLCAFRGPTLLGCSTTKATNVTKLTHATPSQAVASGPEGRQMIAQRVSAGFHPPCTPSLSGATEHPPPHKHEYPIASPELGNTTEHETDKPRRTKWRLHLMPSRPPLLKETHSHAETPRPPRLEHPFITGFLAARRGTAQTRDQGSGIRKEAGGDPSSAAGSGPGDRPIHPDPSKWNCSWTAMGGCSDPLTDLNDGLPLPRHGHR
jgi:hypothetical protein